MSHKKQLKDLNAIDNFMFNELTMQEDIEKSKLFCKTIIEPIIGSHIRNLEIIPQKPYQGLTPDLHGIQIDAYVKAVVMENGVTYSDVEVSFENAIFDLEPNLYQISSEEKRIRYYHSIIDSHIFSSGEDYSKLEKVYVIMIFPYDPFGQNRMLYTIRRTCLEEPNMPYDDGDYTYVLYTKGTKDIPSQELKNMLSFLEDSSKENATSSELAEIHNMMANIKQNRLIGGKFMHTWELQKHIREEGRQEGKQEGRQESLVSSIKNLMDTLHLSMPEAMNALKIPDDKREEYKKLLEKV